MRTAVLPEQIRLLHAPLVGCEAVPMERANRLLVEWGHKLGPAERPFGQEGYTLEVGGRAVAVAVSASTVSNTVAGYTRQQVVELTRLARDPSEPWTLRVMLRVWREVCAPMWPHWPVQAAVSYHKEAWHSGDIYRFDGWEKVAEGVGGSGGGGSWTKKRDPGDPTMGTKTLWLWRYRTGHPTGETT